jgi:hypothetical protein
VFYLSLIIDILMKAETELATCFNSTTMLRIIWDYIVFFANTKIFVALLILHAYQQIRKKQKRNYNKWGLHGYITQTLNNILINTIFYSFCFCLKLLIIRNVIFNTFSIIYTLPHRIVGMAYVCQSFRPIYFRVRSITLILMIVLK